MSINLNELDNMWVEDGATSGTLEHEGLTTAWNKLYNENYNEVRKLAVVVEDGGDYEILRWPDGRVVYSSYPGASEIYQPMGYKSMEALEE